MQNPLLVLMSATLGTAVVWLVWRNVTQAWARAAARRGYFGAVARLFETTTTRLTPTGFTRMAGRLRGLSYDLQVVPDTLTFRKLPALWVMLTQTEPLPLTTTLDVMVRPSLQEPFSHFRHLAREIALPEGLPDDCAIRCDDAAALPPAGLLTRHAALFRDPAIKELVLSPKGLRVVFLAEEAERTRYLLFRDAEMGAAPLPAARIAPLLAALEALREDVLTICRPEGDQP